MTLKTKHIKTLLRGVLISNDTDIVAKYTEYIYYRRSNHDVTLYKKFFVILGVSCNFEDSDPVFGRNAPERIR